MPNEHSHDHMHSNAQVSPFNGPPKTMFVLGLFVGVAACTTLALLFIVWSIVSGHGVALAAGNGSTAPVAVAPSTVPDPNAAAPAPAGAPVKPVVASDHTRGPANAKVTLIEYSDFECPFCKQHESTIQQILQAYPNDVRLVYREYPLSFHQNAQKEAEAAECVASLGGNDAFWKFHDQIFAQTTSNGTGFPLTGLAPLAKSVGVDQTKFQNCLDSGQFTAAVNQSEADGTASGVEGTPGTFVNGTLVEGAVPYSQFKTMIDGILGKT
ncbi:MAG: thioredoxin domain-containing protein [Patescibacteria group bacterium]